MSLEKITEYFFYYKIERSGRSLVSGNIWGTEPGRSFSFDLETHKFFDFSRPEHSGRGFKQLFKIRNEKFPDFFRLNYKKFSQPAIENDQQKDKVYIRPLDVIPHSLTPPNKISFWVSNKRVDIPATTHTYKNARGERIGFILRGIDPETKEKIIRPLSVWERLLPDKKLICSYRQKKFTPVLYNLDLIEAQPEKTIVVVEGEKCADFGMKRGAIQYGLPLIFTTWPFGSHSYATDSAIWNPLKERQKVVLWPDNDEIGKKTMLEIKSRFLPNSLMVKPEKIGLKEKEDIADLPIGPDLKRLLTNIAFV
ncbi:MAG: hypothetical protein OQJ78_05805 [Ignavibacteriaceae bacterium]|nr:hypothetical protein [Ignavibacteriaceae bacterium]